MSNGRTLSNLFPDTSIGLKFYSKTLMTFYLSSNSDWMLVDRYVEKLILQNGISALPDMDSR